MGGQIDGYSQKQRGEYRNGDIQDDAFYEWPGCHDVPDPVESAFDGGNGGQCRKEQCQTADNGNVGGVGSEFSQVVQDGTGDIARYHALREIGFQRVLQRSEFRKRGENRQYDGQHGNQTQDDGEADVARHVGEVVFFHSFAAVTQNTFYAVFAGKIRQPGKSVSVGGEVKAGFSIKTF